MNTPRTAYAIRLYRHARGRLVACEAMCFPRNGWEGVDTVLRRAAVSGRVDIGGEIDDHFADLLDNDGSMVETVALDAASYHALKTRWMRCRVQNDL